MSGSVRVDIDQAAISRIQREFRLMADEVPIALSRAINRSVTAVQTEASRQVRAKYNLKAARVKKNFTTKKANKSNLSGGWLSRGEPVGLLQFGAKQNKTGVSVKVEKAGARRTVAHAFIQLPKKTKSGKPIKSGLQVFWREKDGGKMVPRYDVNRLSGPRVEDALAKPEVQKQLQDKADTTLQTRMAVEANYILDKAR